MCEKEKGKSPHTINSEIKSLSKVFKIANELNHIEVMPSNGLSIVRAKKPQVKVYNQDEIRMMLMYAKKDVYLDVIILLLLQAGPRKGEVIHFKWSDFNKETRTLKVSIKDKWAPKHGRERILRLSERLAGKIDNLPRVNEYIFIQSGAIAEGRRFSGSQFKRYVIYKFVNKLGIEGWLHKFRDTYASYSLACGVDIVKVKERLGHNSLKETDKYARAINEVIVDDVKRIFIGESGELQRG